MATALAPSTHDETQGHTLQVTRMIVTGGVTASVVFVLCWLGTFITFSSPTHAYIALFTRAEIGSLAALAEGSLWSLLFGALVAGAFATIYNATAALGRR